MDSLKLKAYAKINLAIDLLGKRNDGYNEVKMIMQTIDIFDEISITKIEKGIVIKCDNNKIPEDSRNIAYKAANIMQSRYDIDCGVKIDISKNIPIEAGLGGGSADAAAVIEGMNTLFDLRLNFDTLLKIGEKIGADVPYCICKNTVLATGIGEKLLKISNFDSVNVVLIKPNFGISTKQVYKEFDYSLPKERPDFETLLKAIENKKISDVAQNMVNVLETVTQKNNPEIRDIKSKLMENGALGAMMSGSGSTIFALFESEDMAKKAYNKMKNNNTYQCYLTKTICF